MPKCSSTPGEADPSCAPGRRWASGRIVRSFSGRRAHRRSSVCRPVHLRRDACAERNRVQHLSARPLIGAPLLDPVGQAGVTRGWYDASAGHRESGVRAHNDYAYAATLSRSSRAALRMGATARRRAGLLRRFSWRVLPQKARTSSSTVKGERVFRRGGSYIVQDTTAHSGGVWKVANSVRALGSKDTRTATTDALLNVIGR